jgi:hypothetical protein
MNGAVFVGKTLIFEMDTWEDKETTFSCKGRMNVLASRFNRNPLRNFRIVLGGGDAVKPFYIVGIFIIFTHTTLQIQKT